MMVCVLAQEFPVADVDSPCAIKMHHILVELAYFNYDARFVPSNGLQVLLVLDPHKVSY